MFEISSPGRFFLFFSNQKLLNLIIEFLELEASDHTNGGDHTNDGAQYLITHEFLIDLRSKFYVFRILYGPYNMGVF